MNENIKKYAFEPGEEISRQLSDSWGWLIDSSYKPKLVSLFGDIFLMKDGRGVYMLNTGTAELDLIASGWEEFLKKAEGEMGSNWFMISIADELAKKGVKLSPDQCYSYRTLPILGGEYSVDNFYALSAKEHIGVTGDMHKQMKDLPDGASVNIKVID